MSALIRIGFCTALSTYLIQCAQYSLYLIKSNEKRMQSKWKRSSLLQNRIHNQYCVSFLINVYYKDSEKNEQIYIMTPN